MPSTWADRLDVLDMSSQARAPVRLVRRRVPTLPSEVAWLRRQLVASRGRARVEPLHGRDRVEPPPRDRALPAPARRLAEGLRPAAALRARRIAARRARTTVPARTTLADVAMDAGYYDQSHLTRDFVALAGMTPGAYAGRRRVRPRGQVCPRRRAGSVRVTVRDMTTDRRTPPTNDTPDADPSGPGIVPILVYEDIEAGHDYLIATFGFTSGGLHRTDDGTVVHGEVRMGDAAIWLHQVTAEHEMASPAWRHGLPRRPRRCRPRRRRALRTQRGGRRPDRQRADGPGLRPARVRRTRPREPPLVVRHRSAEPHPARAGTASAAVLAARPALGPAGAGGPGLAGQAGHQDLDDDLGIEAAHAAHVEVGRGDQVDGLARSWRCRGGATARAPSWPRTAPCRGRRPPRARRATSSPSSASMLAKCPCSVARSASGPARRRRACGAARRRAASGLALVDGVGQLVARHVARLAEIGRQVVGRRPAPPRRRRRSGRRAAPRPGRDPRPRGAPSRSAAAGVELDRRAAQVLVQPRLAVARLARRHVDDLAVLLDRLDERRRDGPAAAHQHQHRRRERLAAPLRPAAARRRSAAGRRRARRRPGGR